jgi:hypothetical protein
MLSSAVFETVFGLVFVFYATAVICSGAVEAWANLIKKRSKYLLRGLRDLLDGQAMPTPAPVSQRMLDRVRPAEPIAEMTMYSNALVAPVDSSPAPLLDELMAHPLVQPYKHTTPTGKVKRNPAYLPAAVFAKALIDIAVDPETDPSTQRARFKPTASRASHQHVDEVISALEKTTDGSVDKLQASLESWFDGQMDRVSGSYKRWAKRWVIPIALVVAFAFNIDTVAISRSLYVDSGVRAAVLQAASSDQLCALDENGQPKGSDCLPNEIEDLEQLKLPVGWTETRWQQATSNGAALVLKLVGLLLTAAAASLGAPFWFDALNKIGSLRNVGKKPESSS